MICVMERRRRRWEEDEDVVSVEINMMISRRNESGPVYVRLRRVVHSRMGTIGLSINVEFKCYFCTLLIYSQSTSNAKSKRISQI